MSTPRFLVSPDDESLLAVFEREVPGATRLWGTTGYLTPAVFALLRMPLEQMAAKRSLRLLIGELMPAYTAPFARRLRERIAEDPGIVARVGEEAIVREWREAIGGISIGPREAVGLERIAALVANDSLELRGWDPETSRLHGKTYLLTRADGSRLAIVGSANFTPQGLRENIEMLSILDDRRSEEREIIDQIEAALIRLWDSDRAVPVDKGRVAREIRRAAGSREVSIEAFVEVAANNPAAAAELLVSGGQFFANGGELAPHQLQFIAHAYRQHILGGARLLLADEVGLGKTLQIVIFMAMAAIASEKPGLLIVPPSLMDQIQREALDVGVPIARWNGASWVLRDRVWPEAAEPEGRAIHECPTLIGMVSSGLIKQRNATVEEGLRRVRYSVIAADEAHQARANTMPVGTKKSGAAPRLRSDANNLYRFLQALSGSCDSILLATATPMQLRKLEVYDLLGLLRRGRADTSILGSDESIWRRDPERGLEMVGHPGSFTPSEMDDETAILAAIDPLVDPRREAITSAAELDAVYRHRLQAVGIPNDDSRYPAHLTMRDLPLGSSSLGREEGADEIRRLIGGLTPYHRLIVRRTREQLEANGSLKPIGVRLYGEGVGETVVGDPLLLQAAELAKAIITSRAERGAINSTGFLKTTLLRRIFSSLNAGKISLGRLLQNRLAEDDRMNANEEGYEDGDPTVNVDGKLQSAVLNDEERAMAAEALALLESAHDTKFDVAAMLLFDGPPASGGREVPWVDHGCLVFSQFYDTASHLAAELSKEYTKRMVGVTGEVALYTSREHSGVFVNGIFQSWDRDELKRTISEGGFSLVVGTDAASEGLNLQRLGTLINYDLPWNPTRLDQRQGRIKRIGQTRSEVDVANLRYRDTVEEKVYDKLRTRLKDARELLGQNFENLLTPLWDSEIEQDEASSAATLAEIDRAIEEAKRSPFDLGGIIAVQTGEQIYGTLRSSDRMAILGRAWNGDGGLVVVSKTKTDQTPARATDTSLTDIHHHSRTMTTLADLLQAGLLSARESVHPTWGGLAAEGSVTDDGRMMVFGQLYRSPSAAAEAVRKEARKSHPDQMSTAANGWLFWAVERGGTRVTLADLRSAFENQPTEELTEPDRARRAWVVRAGENRIYEDAYLVHHYVGINWGSGMPEVLTARRDEMVSLIERVDPGTPIGALRIRAGQLLTFVHDMEIGDLVVTWRSDQRGIAIGEIVSEVSTATEAPWLRRTVRWLMTELPSTLIPPDLYHSLGSPAAISTPRPEVDAPRRLLELVEQYGKANSTATVRADRKAA